MKLIHKLAILTLSYREMRAGKGEGLIADEEFSPGFMRRLMGMVSTVFLSTQTLKHPQHMRTCVHSCTYAYAHNAQG